MTALKFNLSQIHFLALLMYEVIGNVEDFTLAQKIKEDIAINDVDRKGAKVTLTDKTDIVNFNEKYKKTVELSDDKVKLIKRTLKEVLTKAEKEKKSFKDIQHFIIINEIINVKK